MDKISRLKNYLLKYKKIFGYDAYHERIKYLGKVVKGYESILDVGCGQGDLVRLAPDKIDGLDGNEQEVNKMWRMGLKCYKFNISDDNQFPFSKEIYDAVVSSHLIEHLNPRAAYNLIRNMDRVLKRDGLFIIAAPLAHRNFYHNMSHVKPYTSQAIMRYLNSDNTSNNTFPEIPGKYKIVRIKYIYQQLFAPVAASKYFWPLGIIFNLLLRLGVHSNERQGYILITRKIK
ncbi:MAG: class I SAM-dependent methyltransferase [Promethearchaeota archaeon]|jgi:SAM-dependent methyltransferase